MAKETDSNFKIYHKMASRTMSYESVVPKGFSTMSIGVLVKIFQYVNKEELIRSISLVSKHWRYAVMQPELIKSLYISGNDTSLSFIFDFIRKFKLLETLYIENFLEISSVLLQADKFNLDLKAITLKNCGRLDSKILYHIIKTFPNLIKFELIDTCFTENYILYPIIARLINLRSVNLSKIKNVTIKDLLVTILNCKNLEEITIGLLPANVDLRDDNAILLIANLSPRLKYLSIDSHSLTTRTFEILIECPLLESLFILYGVNLNKEFLMDLFTHLPNLKKFGLTHNCIIGGNDVRDLFLHNLRTFENIIHLDFSFCVLLNDTGINAIAKCCTGLQTIILKSCRSITDIDFLCKRCKLKSLNIAFCIKLQPTFRPPQALQNITIDETMECTELIIKLKVKKFVRIYKELSEYMDDFIRI